jgi:hypothetical protein
MSLAEEWKQLPGGTKMFIIGGGATAIFILIIALKGFIDECGCRRCRRSDD